MTPQVIEALNKSFVQSGQMRAIQELEWPEQEKIFYSFTSDTLNVSKELL